MPVVTRVTFQVRHTECNALGLLSEVSAARWMEEVATQASAEVGWPTSRYQSIGTLWIIRQTQLEFLRPVRVGQQITISTWVEDMRRVRSHRRYEFHDESKTLVARALTDWVYWDTRRQRLASIPPEVMTAYAPETAEGQNNS